MFVDCTTVAGLDFPQTVDLVEVVASHLVLVHNCPYAAVVGFVVELLAFPPYSLGPAPCAVAPSPFRPLVFALELLSSVFSSDLCHVPWIRGMRPKDSGPQKTGYQPSGQTPLEYV